MPDIWQSLRNKDGIIFLSAQGAFPIMWEWGALFLWGKDINWGRVGNAALMWNSQGGYSIKLEMGFR